MVTRSFLYRLLGILEERKTLNLESSNGWIFKWNRIFHIIPRLGNSNNAVEEGNKLRI